MPSECDVQQTTASRAELMNMLRKKSEKVILGESYKFPQLRRISVEEENGIVGSKYAFCIKCCGLLTSSDGNHTRRHVEQVCPQANTDEKFISPSLEHLREIIFSADQNPSTKPLPVINKFLTASNMKEGDRTALYEALGRHCLLSGKSFLYMASPSMVLLVCNLAGILNPSMVEAIRKAMPCPNTIQKFALNLARKLIERVVMDLNPYFERKEISLLIDHGSHIHMHLSVYASFVDEDFHLRIVPLGFPTATKKSAKETVADLKKLFMELGIPHELLNSCRITSDGALLNVGKTLGGSIRCVNHSLHLVAERVINPLKVHEGLLHGESTLLSLAKKTIRDCVAVADAVRDSPEVMDLLRSRTDYNGNPVIIPSTVCATRWLSNAKCVTEVQGILSNLVSLSDKLPDHIGRCINNLAFIDEDVLNAVVLVLQIFLDKNTMFQKRDCITLHFVAPLYKRLACLFKKYEDGFIPTDKNYDVNMLRAMGKSARIAVESYYEEFTEVHLAAALLSPTTKGMKMFRQEEVTMAKNFVTSLFEKYKEISAEEPPSKRAKNLYHNLTDFICDSETPIVSEELERYYAISEVTVHPPTVEEFWKDIAPRFPTLHMVARNVFSSIPSEAVCESCFSLAKNILSKNRFNLSASSADLHVTGSQLANLFPQYL